MQEHVLGLAATLTKFLWKGRGTSCFHRGCFLLLFLFICCLLVGWTFFWVRFFKCITEATKMDSL